MRPTRCQKRLLRVPPPPPPPRDSFSSVDFKKKGGRIAKEICCAVRCGGGTDPLLFFLKKKRKFLVHYLGYSCLLFLCPRCDGKEPEKRRPEEDLRHSAVALDGRGKHSKNGKKRENRFRWRRDRKGGARKKQMSEGGIFGKKEEEDVAACRRSSKEHAFGVVFWPRKRAPAGIGVATKRELTMMCMSASRP